MTTLKPDPTRSVGLLLAATALVAAGCSGSSGGGAAAADGSATVSVGTLPIANSAPLYLGIQEGFFEEEGLTVEPVVAQGSPDIVTGVATGAQDLGGVGYLSAGVALGSGVPIRVISASDAGGLDPESDWTVTLAAADSPISGVGDLAGRTVSVNALGGIGEAVIKASLDAAGVDPGSVNLIEVPFPEVPAALAAGRIDAGWTAEPFVTIALNQGNVQVDAPWLAIAPEFPVGSYVTSDRFLQESPDVVDRFARAMDRSVDFAAANPDAVRDILPTFTSIDPEIAAEIRLPVFDSEPDPALIQRTLDLATEYDVVDEVATTEDLLRFRDAG